MKLTAGAFNNIRFTGVLLLVVALAVTTGVYLMSVEQQQRYLVSRNFRLLTVLATHTDNLITNGAGVFRLPMDERRLAQTKRDSKRRVVLPDAIHMKQWITDSKKVIPLLNDAELVKPSGDPVFPTPPGPVTPRLALAADGTRRLQVTLVDENDEKDEKKVQYLTVKLGLATLLSESFESKLRQGAFDTLVLATPDGRVLLATGRRRRELQSISLDTVLTGESGKAAPSFTKLARTIAVADSVIAGVNYQMFMQPCCGAVASSPAAGPLHFSATGLVVAGFVESAALRSASLAISPTLVIAGILLTLLALVVWPFLKFTLLGNRQRITQWDVLQLAACSVFGLALGATIIITADVYNRLLADLDTQLETLAHQLGTNARRELGVAYARLVALDTSVDQSCGGALAEINSPAEAKQRCAGARKSGHGAPPAVQAAADKQSQDWDDDDFEAFSLIDKDGVQVFKAAPGRLVPTRLSVQSRGYFRNIGRDRDLFPCPVAEPKPPAADAPPPPRCFVQAVWSWTTGKPQAVMSTRARNGDEVATISFPMRSLIGPALPPGFEYAVVSRTGQVLFHSDPQRNVYEDIFLETDQNRRLRALIAGHSEGWLDAMYWGRSYRAYVMPAGIGDWSVVTLADQRSLRGLLLEWTTVSLLMLSAYLLAWFVVTVLTSKFGLSWLWPDPRRRRSYIALSLVCAGLLGVSAAVAVTGDSGRLLTVGVASAAAAWLTAVLLLRRRPSVVTIDNTPGGTSATLSYKVAGALFLTISGIVPGVAFIVRSYDVHVWSYIKHRELGFVRTLDARLKRAAVDKNAPLCGLKADPDASIDRYCSFFYDMSVRPDAACEAGSKDPHLHEDGLKALVEEYLPYYAESSVEMRELLHWTAADQSWRSCLRGGRLLLELSDDDSGPTNLQASSMLPRPEPLAGALRYGLSLANGTVKAASASDTIAEPLADEREHPNVRLLMPYLAPLLLAALGWIAYLIMSYVLRHVFLTGVCEPLWASGQLMATAGDNVLVLCGNATQMSDQFQDVLKLDLGAIVRSADPVAEWRGARIRISNAEAGRAVAIADLLTDLDDVDTTCRKLQLLEELVNDSSRTVVVLVEKSPAVLQDIVRPGQEAQDRALWSRLAARFIVVDWRDAPAGTIAVESRSAGGAEEPADPLQQVLDDEGRYDRHVRQVCADISRSKGFRSWALTPERLRDEITERVSTYYEQLWNTCCDDEKVVLAHVAQYGLANVVSRRALRRLLARRLLVKAPELHLMNRTFRDFILAPAKLAQVAQLEGSAEPSTWDRLRLPLAVTATAAAGFLFITQRDMFNETVTMITGVAATVPTLAQAISKIARWDAPGSPPRANA
ncbi:MAG TPA: cache domain-containing protein [Vicinamibacterales bacterium]|jgi:hypothetical protein